MPSSSKQDEALSETKQLTEMLPRGRKESHTQTLSRRSNSLAFEPRHWASHPPTSTKTLVCTAEPDSYFSVSASETRTPTLAKIRSHGTPLYTITSHGQTPRGYTLPYIASNGTKQRQIIRSLIPPDNSAMYNQYRNLGTHPELRRKPSQSLKRRQSTGSIRSSLNFPPCPLKTSLSDLPTEILNQIMSHLPQKAVHELLLASPKSLIEPVTNHMYHRPQFASTYRFAQFVHTISLHKQYALRVRHLDVSYFTAVPLLQRTPMAGWREWKYRSHSLYRSPRKFSVPPKKPRVNALPSPRRGHPPPNPFLESWALSRDIPLGGLCHCLQACENLRVVNLSRCQLAEDHLVVDDDYPPVAWTGRIYVSDVPKSWTWKSDELRPVYNMYVIEQLVKLEHLETIIAANWVGLSTGMVRELVNRGMPSLQKVDFVGSGLEKEKAWAIKGSREEVRRIIGEMDRNEPAKKVVSFHSSP